MKIYSVFCRLGVLGLERLDLVSYAPDTVADYSVMLMLMCCRKISHIMNRSLLQDYTLNGKIGKNIGDCTVGIIGTGQIIQTQKWKSRQIMFLCFPNVLLTPHTAFYTDTAVYEMAWNTVTGVYDMMNGIENPLILLA